MKKLSKAPPIPRSLMGQAPSLKDDGYQFIRLSGSPNRAERDMLYSVYSSGADSYFVTSDTVEHGKRWMSAVIFSAKARVNHGL